MTRDRKKIHTLLILCAPPLVVFLLTTVQLFSAETTTTDKLRVGYSSVVGARIALWAPHDVGHFARQGIQTELVVISGIQGMQALVAKEVGIFLGPTEGAVQAAAGGADVVILATAEPIEYKLIVQPNIKSTQDLRRQKIGIDRIGGTSYHLTVQMLEKLKMKATEVELIPVSGGGPQRVAAFRSGLIGGVVTTVSLFEQLKIPYNILADAKVIGNSFITTKSFRDGNPRLVQRFMRASIDSRQWLKDPNNREATLQIFSRYLRTTDPIALDLNYRTYIEPLRLYPYTDMDDLKANVTFLTEANPTVRRVNLSGIVDNSFIYDIQQNALSPK